MDKINIYLARHGETIFNRKDYIQGQSDAPLTQSGIQAAIDLGKNLKHIDFDLAISSDLKRAILTKDIILENSDNQNVQKMINSDFGELNFGEVEGDYGKYFWDDMGQKLNLDFKEIEKRSLFEKFHYLYDPMTNPTAEKMDHFKKRIVRAVNETVKTAQSLNLKNILVVSHGVVVNGLIELYDPDHVFDGFILNSSITKLVAIDDNITIEYIGKREYL